MSNSFKEYYIDPYKKELKAQIVDIKENKIYLDKTIFYPEGGGQPGDRGYINGYKVVDTQKDNGKIAHFINEPFDLKIGDSVILKLDWTHRYSYMKMHTAQHLISGILHSSFNVATVSVHQGSQFLSIEIADNSFSKENCYKVEDIANDKIIESLDVSYLEMSKAEAQKLDLRRSIKVDGLIRVVKINNADLIACGGLHVKNTSEIKRVMFCGVEKIRKHFRLLFKVSESAIEEVRKYDSIIKELCTLHSAKVETLVECEKNYIEKNLEVEKQLRSLKKENANLVLNSIIKENNQNVIFSDISDYNIDFKDIDLNVDKAIFLFRKESESLKWYVYLGNSYLHYDFQDLRVKVLSLIDGKGGGKFPSFQGKGVYKNIENCEKAFLGYFNER
ncbi:MAG: alanyl-tRNA editing protein [Sphaerochaetaceae bacterium]|nr:alanyl-tRNA editing protein [Sphaerochaetaceae bacterium]